MDGTAIRIKAPSANEFEYVGRKGGHTINMQGIALADGSFSNVIAKYPGSAHDARIFRESSLYTELLEGRKEGLLLGDSAYALAPFLMKPLPNPTADPEKRYQAAFLATRAAVERAFGQLKQRFNCLHQELRYTPERCCSIIAACFALHNFAVRRGMEPFYGPNFPEDDDDPVVYNNNADPAMHSGKVRQLQIINRYFAH